MTNYTTPSVSCVSCRKVFSAKGIFSHFISIHTSEGKERCIKVGAINAKLPNSICNVLTIANTRQQRMAAYNTSPKLCEQCKCTLPFKKRSNAFCSKSCSCTNHNMIRGDKSRTSRLKNCIVCNKETSNAKCCSKECGYALKIKFHNPEDRIKHDRAKNREANARYISRVKYQTPVDENLNAIKQFYLNCPEGYEVDHIIPVSKGGHHSISNLQYLTKKANRQKSAKLNWCPGGESNARHHS